MSENSKNNPSGRVLPESQSERWIKYGSNVALAIILAIVLAILLTWAAQRASARVDTTKSGSLSLKPQTLQVLKQLKQHITLVSLYVRTEQNQQSSDEDEVKVEPIDYATRVADLLDEYRRHSGMIDVKVIDPVKEKDKLEDLHQQFIAKYGSQIKSYKDYLTDWKAQYEQVRKLIADEGDLLKPFGKSSALDAGASDENAQLSPFTRTIQETIPNDMQKVKGKIDHELERKYPDFKGAVSASKELMEGISERAASIVKQAPQWAAEPALPAAFRQYIGASVPRFEKIKKLCDDLAARADKLGELKVDQLEQALNVDNPILVLGENEWRVLPATQIWQPDTDIHSINNGKAMRPRFAGEQAITSAIFTLETPTKQKICFVRPGGAPLTNPGFMGIVAGGPLSVLADRLRDYNFDVTEKDMSGQWQMQAQMQRMPSAPEPSDEEIRDAVWVVIDFPNEQQQGMPPSAVLGAKLAEHLKEGGSAMVLAEPRAENLHEALADWGIELHPEAIAIHQTVQLTEGAAADFIEEAKTRPYIFDVRSYGDHPIAKPELNLEGIFLAPTPVHTNFASGVTSSPLIPFSEAVPGLKTWGETDFDSLSKGPTYDPAKGDLPPPLYGGAAAEKGKGRLVVIGSARFLFNDMVGLRQRGVSLFPGNLELGTNAIFWLAKLDPMISISPTAMDVSRIGTINKGVLGFWRIGVLMILLPGLVIAAGLGVWSARKD